MSRDSHGHRSSRVTARRAALAALIVVGVVASGCSGSGLGEGSRPIDAGTEDRRPAAPFFLPALAGPGRVTLASLRGRPALINFWASWCEPCREETPALVRFSGQHPGLQVVGIATRDARADARAFARRFAIPYRLADDPEGRIASTYGAVGLPVSVLIDAEGRVVSTTFGALDERELADLAASVGR